MKLFNPSKALLSSALSSLLASAQNQEITSSLSDSFWNQLRANLANNLIQATDVSPDYAYQQVYNTFPENGNCWCSLDKSTAIKGPAQDAYDTACKSYHSCIHCGELRSSNAIKNKGMTQQFTMNVTTTDSFEVQTPSFAYNDLYNYDNSGDTDMMAIYDWTCSNNNDAIGMAVCSCFKEMETQMTNVMLQDIVKSENAESQIDFSYNSVCNNSAGPGGDSDTDSNGDPVTPVPPEDQDSESETSDPSDPNNDNSSTNNPSKPPLPDSCCGDFAPTWFPYYSDAGRRACCNGKTFDTLTKECCFGSIVASIGDCPSDPNDESLSNENEHNEVDCESFGGCVTTTEAPTPVESPEESPDLQRSHRMSHRRHQTINL